MISLTDEQRRILGLFARAGYLPDRPFLRCGEDARVLMRLGLVELVDPPRQPGRSKGLPFARLTRAGVSVLDSEE